LVLLAQGKGGERKRLQGSSVCIAQSLKKMLFRFTGPCGMSPCSHLLSLMHLTAAGHGRVRRVEGVGTSNATIT
jgi:hypothetical protein